jgi:SAM-dependent methyltransferase
MDKLILDATCGGRSIWFNKHHPAAIYCDAYPREAARTWKSCAACGESERTVRVEPDVVCDFTGLPFKDESFHLVVFDPPHLIDAPKSSWMRVKYGTLTRDWQPTIKRGVDECMRVLKPHGVLIFKWSDIHIPTPEVIKAIGREPLFGHRSGKRSNTHWMTFMKGVCDD